jgi:hypothetical protein
MERPSIEDICLWISSHLPNINGDITGRLTASLLTQSTTELDGTTVMLLCDEARERRAVMLISAPAAPDMVNRAMTRAHQAKKMLSVALGKRILDPLMTGRFQGLSYAVLPYCIGLSEHRAVWWVQRSLLRSSIFDWLYCVNKSTANRGEQSMVTREFGERLGYIASLNSLRKDMRRAAAHSSARLESGEWIPKHVLMHGDLWKSNILVSPRKYFNDCVEWSDRFVVIDWPGSTTNGYAFFDLLRLAASMKLRNTSLRAEIARHSQALDCNPEDARSYLLAALGHIAMTLENFPMERFVNMAESAFIRLDGAIPDTN